MFWSCSTCSLLAFVVWDGRLPETFAIETMYADHEQELRLAHQAASEVPVGETGSAP